jgi:hypothetical protein
MLWCLNHSGNTTPENAAQAYCRLFPEMWTPYNNFLCASDSAVKGESASALWVLQVAYHTKHYQHPSGKRVFFMDNFYTHHTLGLSLKKKYRWRSPFVWNRLVHHCRCH